MKKNPIKKFFSGIVNFFDKLIIVPVTKFILYISKNFDGISKNFEKFLVP